MHFIVRLITDEEVIGIFENCRNGMWNDISWKKWSFLVRITFSMFKQILTSSGSIFRPPLVPVLLYQIIKILFSISRALFLPLSRFPHHILQSTHLTQLDGRCSVYCIIWSKILCHISGMKVCSSLEQMSFSCTYLLAYKREKGINCWFISMGVYPFFQKFVLI